MLNQCSVGSVIGRVMFTLRSLRTTTHRVLKAYLLPITSQLAINKGVGNVMSAGIVSQQVILKNSA